MALESYRRQRVVSNRANEGFDEMIIFNAGDIDGRIIRFEAARGNGRAATACKLWIDKGEGLAVFCELNRIDMPTPTWEAAVPVKGLQVGTYDAAIRLEDTDGSITESMPIKVHVYGSILSESEATEEMQDALDDFEIRTNTALANIAEAIEDAETATTNANTATTSANSAAVAANTAAQNIGAEVDAQGILTVTDADGTVTTYDGAATAAQSATSAAGRANAAAVSAETAAGNIGAEVDSSGVVTVTDADGSQTEFSGLADAVLLARGAAERADDAAIGANAAKDSANSAALSANSAATSATSAAGTATGAAETATSAATSANTAATSATSAATTATAAATSANSAASSANSAATSATNAATAATTATTNATTATTNAQAATTAANTAAESATDAATAASAAAEDATDAATEARDAAAAALASVGNVVLGEMSMLDGSIETVDDAFVSPIREIEVEGKSTQVSYTGKNLVDVANWDFSQPHETGVFQILDFGEDKTIDAITASFICENVVFSVSNAALLDFRKNDGSHAYKVPSAYGLSANVENTGTFSGTSFGLTFRYIYIYLSTSAYLSFSSGKITVQIEYGSTATPYEPYVGGIPSPNPDYPQAIHSVAEAGQVITGRCVWGGEKMADDIVAAVGDATKAYKGQDDHGKYVVVVGSVPVRGKIFFDRTKADSQYTFILHSRKNVSNAGANLLFNYTDGTADGLSVAPLVEEGVIYTYPSVSRQGKSLASVGGTWTSGTTYIYYEQSGLFEGVLSNDDFVQYLGTTTPLIPSGVEPLRSLPNGVHDELIVREDGSREIVRRVGTVVFDETKRYAHYGSASDPNYDGVSCVVSAMMVGNRNSGYSDKAVVALNSNGVYAWLGVNSNLIYLPNILRKLNIEFADFPEWIAENPITFAFPLATEVIEPLPSLTMPSAPSSDVTAWLDSKDESSAFIATDSSVAYERSMQIVIDRLEQAIADL